MNYNYIAPFYDSLSRISFLNNQQKAHYPILPFIKNDMRILWIGGGSGWFLKDIDQLNLNLQIDYVEFSSAMMKAAKARKLNFTQVNFIQEDIFKYQLTEKYDLIITAFFFDHFKDEECIALFERLNQSLKNKGFWFYVEFNQNQNFIQRFITKAMVLFFNCVAGIKNQDFPKIEYLFDHYQKIEDYYYFGNYIVSRIYQK